ncbi:MAG: SH3 domain protein [Cycloclasticus sp.]|jgi:SH3 domain protein|tara:strand:- start:3227 stop:3859 length:633 start_codon:yes stop_codon:yes gene_type:complete
MTRLLLLLLMLWPLMAYSAHITDKLLAGMYSTPDNSQQPVQLLPSGTPVELINEKNGFVQVQLVDGKTGWVEKRFLSEEKPAKVRLLALQSKYRQLQEKLDSAEQQLSALTSPQEQQQVKALQTALATAEKTIVSLEEDVKQLAETKNKTTGSDDAAAVQQSTPKSEQQVGDSYWWVVLLVAAGAIITGAYTGIRIQDRRQRNRHGGFRV